MNAKILPRITVAVLATMTGLYPVFYYVAHSNNPGLLGQKSAELLASYFYRGSFYTHITFGGVALLIGWLQFSKKIRARNLNLHRTIRKLQIKRHRAWMIRNYSLTFAAGTLGTERPGGSSDRSLGSYPGEV